MSSQKTVEKSIEVSVQNIGGIDDTSLEISPGVSVLTGRNATNRTSLLRALMGALGSENVALKGDADEGTVELVIDGRQYTRNLSRRQGTIGFDGEPFLDDSELADLFAFLLESNEARRAVERGNDLYDIIMRPVDTDEIDTEIDRLEAEREELDRELEELEELESQLPGLEENRTQLTEEIENIRTELETKEAELEKLKTSEAETTFDELREARRELESLRTDLEDEERIIEALQEDRSELESELDGLASVEDGDLDELEETINRHRNSIQTLESTINELQSVIQFNESMLEGSESDVFEMLHDGAVGGSITDRLVDDGQEVVCWTCGSQVETDQIQQTIKLLQDTHSEKVEELRGLRNEIDELESERKHIERTRNERRRITQQLEEVKSEIEERTNRVDELEEEVNELETQVDELKEEAESLETDDRDERLTLHREINEIEFEVDRFESELAEVEAQIQDIEGRLDERDEIEARRDEIDAEIEKLRSRIDRLETEAVEQFNDQMDHILDLLEFENLERVWIEKIESEVREGRKKVTKPAFDLHVVRTAESGSVYEDTVDHLSESEREVVGLVFALSGYLVHEVYEQVPFMLLDSLEALDADRISILVDHLAEQAPNLVVALLPEDASAVDDYYDRITEI